MNDTATIHVWTTDELLSLPEDGVDRELIRGEMSEESMTKRSPSHSSATAKVSHFLQAWVSRQAKPKGRVLSGEAAFRIRTDPDTTVGIDVAYISALLAASTPRNAKIVDGPPILAVEILSPSDQEEKINAKIDEYLAAGVKIVWIVDPIMCTVQIYRPDELPTMVNTAQELTAEPFLAGFRVCAAELFED